jgi:N-acetylmuramoyl-L-alanine amidase
MSKSHSIAQKINYLLIKHFQTANTFKMNLFISSLKMNLPVRHSQIEPLIYFCAVSKHIPMPKAKIFSFGCLLTTLLFFFPPLLNTAFNNTLASVNVLSHKGRLIPLNPEPPFRIKTIVIDAGHGGHDPGCSGANSVEKHLALAIAKSFASNIAFNYPDVAVILTRDTDVFIPLHERAAIANKAQADLFISIHCNALPGSSATWGSETYVMGLHTAEHNLDVAKRENNAILLEDNYERNYDYDPNSPEGHILLSMFQNAYLEQSILFAERVEHHIKATAERRSRGVKQAGFVVLKETAMPSVLVEAGFLTSSKDEQFLLTEQGQADVAEALLQAFAEYKNILEGVQDSPAVSGILATNTPQVQQPPAKVETPINQTASTTFYTPPVSTTPSQAVVTTTAPVPDSYRYTPPQTESVAVQPEPMISRELYPNQGTISAPVPAQDRALQPKGTGDTSWAENLGTETVKKEDVFFSVQLAASPQILDTSSPQWKGTGYLIEVHQEEELYKYQVRNIKSTQLAFATRQALQQQGFTDAFLVAYRNGRRISLGEAQRLLEE